MRTLHYLLFGIAALLLGSTGWKHRNDAWLQDLLHTAAPAPPAIRFDNGSVRDTLPPVAHNPNSNSNNALNTTGKLKKCAGPRGVVYTDQICPPGTAVAAVTGGNVTIVEGNAGTAKSPGDAPKALRDALDVSGNNDLREKMLDRAVGQ